MRIVGEIPNPSCKITIFSWNNRYIIKIEQGFLEQTYKVDQFDVIHENDIYQLVNDDFIKQALHLFNLMAKSLKDRLISI